MVDGEPIPRPRASHPLVQRRQLSDDVLSITEEPVVFRAVVEDRSFGGTGTVWFRVWPGLAGKLGEEIEVNWETMPARVAEDAPPLEEGWWTRQLELLRRIQRGETTFRLRGHDPAQGAEFDELVEYLLAMQRRGLITFGTPLANLRGDSQYAAVTDVEAHASMARNSLRVKAQL
jgi:hypothetical protein